MKYILFFIFIYFSFSSLSANDGSKFLCLKSDKVNMRTGPESRYNVKYIYIKKNLPFKILGSFEEWYFAEDPFGEKGWIKKNLFFSSKKNHFVFVSNQDGIICFESASENLKKRIKIDSFHILKLKENCKNSLCEVILGKKKIWCKKNDLWGV